MNNNNEGFLRPEVKKQLMGTRVVNINQQELNSIRQELSDVQIRLNEVTSKFLESREMLKELAYNTRQFSDISSGISVRLMKADRINTVAIIVLATIVGIMLIAKMF